MSLGEDEPGFGAGVPEVDLWIRSQDPVDWFLVLIAAALFIGVATLKGLQFHRIARATGIDGTVGQHWRAYLYGQGVGRMVPFKVGEVAWASALEGQGAARSQASRVVFLLKGFLLFEIAAFAFIGLVLSGAGLGDRSHPTAGDPRLCLAVPAAAAPARRCDRGTASRGP